MQCLKPVKIQLSDEQVQHRLSLPDTFPLSYRLARFVYVPCGKCEACQMKKRQQWSFRLRNEMETSNSAYFITLTYDDDSLTYNFQNIDGKVVPVPIVVKKDVQLFLKRLRKHLDSYNEAKRIDNPNFENVRLRYFLVSEYGPNTLRPHYHMLLFNFPNDLTNKIDEFIDKSWGNGFISISPVTDARIMYLCSYCLDNSTLPKYLAPNFMLCSRKPGIGSSFFDKDNTISKLFSDESDIVTTIVNGKPFSQRIPRYYKDKLFDEHLNDTVTAKHIERYSKEYSAEQRAQADWLSSHGYPVNGLTLKSPIDGSPLSLKLQGIEVFKQRIQNKCKNRKL